jgi:CheY-like chemotaxis protein
MPGCQVLVVEDDFDIRDTLIQILEQEGYVVRGAANGLEALELLTQKAIEPKLVLLDLMMPVMNGWQFMAELEKAPALANIPVVIISADSAAEQKRSSLRAVAFLKKPVQLETLLDTVQRYCH